MRLHEVQGRVRHGRDPVRALLRRAARAARRRELVAPHRRHDGARARQDHGTYVNSALAKSDAVMNGFDEAIMLSADGHVCEGSAENVFMVRRGVLYTPDPSQNILEGVTRRAIMTLARRRARADGRRARRSTAASSSSPTSCSSPAARPASSGSHRSTTAPIGDGERGRSRRADRALRPRDPRRAAAVRAVAHAGVRRRESCRRLVVLSARRARARRPERAPADRRARRERSRVPTSAGPAWSPPAVTLRSCVLHASSPRSDASWFDARRRPSSRRRG